MKQFSTNGDLHLLAQQIATRFPDADPVDLGMLGRLIVDIHDAASDMYGQTLLDLARTRPKNYEALRSELVDLKEELVRLQEQSSRAEQIINRLLGVVARDAQR